MPNLFLFENDTRMTKIPTMNIQYTSLILSLFYLCKPEYMKGTEKSPAPSKAPCKFGTLVMIGLILCIVYRGREELIMSIKPSTKNVLGSWCFWTQKLLFLPNIQNPESITKNTRTQEPNCSDSKHTCSVFWFYCSCMVRLALYLCI